MIKILKTSMLLRILPIFVSLGFFVCVIHIVPQNHHQADSHSEHGTSQVVCVDHQVSLSSSQKDHHILVQIAILPQINLVPELGLNTVSLFTPRTDQYDPPNKTPLYIKNNTFLI